MTVSLVRDNMKKILRFTASWCQPCKGLEMNLNEAELNIPIEVVDIDTNDKLAIDYMIRSVPTLVLLDDDKEMRRITGVRSASQLKEWAND